MKTLFTIAKIIPRLGSENEAEKAAAFRLIETKLRADGISWTDVGMRLTEFLIEIAGYEEKELPKPEEKPVSAWTSAAPVASPRAYAAAGVGAAPGFTPAPGPAQAWTNPQARPWPKSPDVRCFRGYSGQLAVVKDLLLLTAWTNAEKQNLLVFEQLLSSGLPLSKKQEKQLEEWSKKI